MHEAPLEFSLIQAAFPPGFYPPTADFLEELGYASSAPLFKKPKFRRALKHYRKYGVYSGPPKKTSAKQQLFYMKIRKNQMRKEL